MAITVPTYGSKVTDTQGRTGVAMFDPNTGKPLAAPVTSNIPVPVAGSTIVDTQGRSGIAAFNPNTGLALTPQSLAPATPFPLVSANQTPTYPVSSLPVLQPTPQETKASGLSAQLGAAYDSMVGKSAYQTQQNQTYGVNTAQAAIQDLSAQLTGLKNEAAAIPLQLQQGAADRGVTTPVLAKQENSRLRTNAIASLGVSTLLAASQGQLANAQSMANQAVAQKYDPILERITAMKANLDLISNDPLTSLQDKNRALQQQAIQDQLTQQTSQAKANATEVWQIATTAAQNGNDFMPSGTYTNLATTLQAISQAPTKEAALQIAVQTGLVQGAVAAPGTTASGASTVKVLGSASTGYFSYDTATGVKTPISSAQAAAGGGSTSTTSSKTVGADLTDAQNAIKAGADPEAVRKAFLADHPTSSASWNSYFGVSAPTTGYPKPAPAPAPAKTGLFGWGFLGL